MRFSRLLISVATLAASGPALAEQAAVPGVSGASFVQGLLGLIFVIGLLLFATWMMRRLSASGILGNSGGMRVVAGLSVGPRERILLLEVGETWVVVGVTATQMRTLHTMPKGELPAMELDKDDGAFTSWLKKAGNRRGDAH